MASSTKIPTTNASASSEEVFKVKPASHMAPKVGMMDSGKANAETSVDRQSRRNHHTTSTASSAPSHNESIEAW